MKLGRVVMVAAGTLLMMITGLIADNQGLWGPPIGVLGWYLPAPNFAVNFPSIPSGSITVDGTTYAKTSAGIQSAVDACTSTCGNVYLKAGTYTINSRITPHSNLHIYGDGPTKTVLQGYVGSDWDIFYQSATVLSNFALTDLGFDFQNNTSPGSGISLGNTNWIYLNNLDFKNSAT
jgi:Pectate lyase superfamily protein